MSTNVPVEDIPVTCTLLAPTLLVVLIACVTMAIEGMDLPAVVGTTNLSG